VIPCSSSISSRSTSRGGSISASLAPVPSAGTGEPPAGTLPKREDDAEHIGPCLGQAERARHGRLKTGPPASRSVVRSSAAREPDPPIWRTFVLLGMDSSSVQSWAFCAVHWCGRQQGRRSVLPM